jgi:DNA-directed RNA polymerase subunit N (RpoN/RPB10)
MTCGKVLADKWEEYVRRCGEADAAAAAAAAEGKKAVVAERGEKTAHGRVLDELGVVNICCRIAMQTHVDMSLII